MTDTKELRKLAEAAAALDHNENASWYEEKYLLGMAYYPKNARFIAAANPQTVIALLDTIEAKDAEIERLKYVLNRVLESSITYHDDGTPVISDEVSDMCNEVLK